MQDVDEPLETWGQVGKRATRCKNGAMGAELGEVK
jgi:hypothetical protein